MFDLIVIEWESSKGSGSLSYSGFDSIEDAVNEFSWDVWEELDTEADEVEGDIFAYDEEGEEICRSRVYTTQPGSWQID